MQSICLYFTKYDLDILAWVNMLRENRLSPATWVQAVVVAEYKQFKLDIGSIVPAVQQKTALFGDDTKRSADGEYEVGSRLNIRVTRKIVLKALEEIVGENEMTAPIIKMILRKNIGFLSRLPNIPPDPMQLRDIFVRGMGIVSPVQPKKGVELPIEKPKIEIEPPVKRSNPEKRKNPLLSYIN